MERTARSGPVLDLRTRRIRSEVDFNIRCLGAIGTIVANCGWYRRCSWYHCHHPPHHNHQPLINNKLPQTRRRHPTILLLSVMQLHLQMQIRKPPNTLMRI